MLRDEITEMARHAGFSNWYEGELQSPYVEGSDISGMLEDFAKLVAAKEREACAVIAEEWFCGCGRGKCPEGDLRAQDIANSIRARGEPTSRGEA